MIEVKHKDCTLCKESKPLYEFKRIKQNRDGLSTRCSACIDKKKSTTEIQKIRKRFPERISFNPYPVHSAGRWRNWD